MIAPDPAAEFRRRTWADLPSVIAILNSYILVMAAGQRVGIHGADPAGGVCLAACPERLFPPCKTMFLDRGPGGGAFFATVGDSAAGAADARQRNVGDGITRQCRRKPAGSDAVAMPLAG